MEAKSHTPADLTDLPQHAVQLAAEILRSSRNRESKEERARSGLMARMMQDQPGKKFTIAMADQVLRMHRPARAASRMDGLVEEYGVPKYFGPFDRFGLWAGNFVGQWFPNLILPFVKSKVRKDAAHVIISGEKENFSRYVDERKQDDIRINFNQLGEAVLGDHEARKRLDEYLKRLAEPGIDYCSVKLSSVVSQISLTGYRQTVEAIKPALREIYRAAIEGGKSTTGSTGGTAKFVNLDMEEYRDLQLTVDVFQEVLDEPEFEKLEAGIVLQAYLPDSFTVLQSLTQWARKRFDRTGAEIKFRLVKGANLAMETVEASVRDWEQAPYHSKLESDANYKRMLEFATRPENAKVMRVGVASHNLFDIAYAMLLRSQRGVQDRVEFEMLEGMANAQALEVRERSDGLVVYTPVCYDHEFESAVAYLVRRLDENTAPGSFLGALFALREGSAEWDQQVAAFMDSCELAYDPALNAKPNRKQNRLKETFTTPTLADEFHNAADTDFSLPCNREWATAITESHKDKTIEPIPLQIAGSFSTENLTGVGSDPSRPGHVPYKFAQATAADIEKALDTAVTAQTAWSEKPISDRQEILFNVAAEFARQRGDTIGSMLVDAGKSIIEADVEISEAIDFANYYARSLSDEGWFDGTRSTPAGVVVVTPPWNFPYAIPAGGVLAALMAGNSVILKPARESVLVAWMIVQQLWKAGVPKDVLQFTPTVDGETGRLLIDDDRTSAVILTGSIFTAQLFQSWRPNLRLYAETSGKNCVVITAAADPDLAIYDLVKGAFGHAGQKCSATSIALVQREFYESEKWRNQLKDAVESLHIGGSWDPSASVTPIIREPDEYLQRGLNQLDEGESWLVEPKMVDGNPCLWRPGVRLGVKPGSWYHTHECFGPVTGLIPFDTLDEAIEIQNSSDFGLTGGLQSLDPKEIEIWREKVEVGNAYINRGTTGAIVRRQPFGGWKDSCVGPGSKAGGPNYVASLMDWEEVELPKLVCEPEQAARDLVVEFASLGLDREYLMTCAGSYAYWWDMEFSREHDPSQVHGETNHFRYPPRPWHVLRIQADSATAELVLAKTILAIATVGKTKLRVSLQEPNERLEKVAGRYSDGPVVESDADLVTWLTAQKSGSMRILGEYDPNVFSPVEIGNIPIIQPNAFANGRIELLTYLREQSISETVHRYGNII